MDKNCGYTSISFWAASVDAHVVGADVAVASAATTTTAAASSLMLMLLSPMLELQQKRSLSEAETENESLMEP